MLRTAQLVVYMCFLGCAAVVWPMAAQEAISAADQIQNFKLSRVEDIVAQHDKMLVSINEKMWYTQGGVAGIYALLGILALFNLKVVTKK